jgi:hypothetical protein
MFVDAKQQVEDYLRAQSAPVPVLHVAKALAGEHGTARMVNPYLYALEREGKARRTSERPNGAKPMWSYVHPASQ